MPNPKSPGLEGLSVFTVNTWWRALEEYILLIFFFHFQFESEQAHLLKILIKDCK